MDLKEFFRQHPKAAIAFSGGVDSSYLLYAALQCGADVRAYYVKGAFQPQFELDDAQRLARDIHAPMTVLRADVLRDETVTANPANRGYYCKKVVFSSIAQAALADGYTVLLDGTNASDDAGDRPGMRALQELQVLSPLRLCGLTKPEIPPTRVSPRASRRGRRSPPRSSARRRAPRASCSLWASPTSACAGTRARRGCSSRRYSCRVCSSGVRRS